MSCASAPAVWERVEPQAAKFLLQNLKSGLASWQEFNRWKVGGKTAGCGRLVWG